MKREKELIQSDAPILVTGSNGFIGRRVVANLLNRGFAKVRCLVRPPANSFKLRRAFGLQPSDERVEIFEGNLLSREDCEKVAEDVQVIYHLAAGRGAKSYPDAFINSAVATRNLLDACVHHGSLKRFVNVSSFTVYTNRGNPGGRLLDETAQVERRPVVRGAPYCFAKVKQEEIVSEYGIKHHLPYVHIRPGAVYGPGNEQIHGRVGLGTFGIFLHLGGANSLPLTYVVNCAEAIVLAGLVKGIDGEVFNVVDDELPTSRQFLIQYKKQVKRFPSLYIGHGLSYILCLFWEKYSKWSQGQLPNVYNRKVWHTTWKRTRYSNVKLKERLGWIQKIPTSEGLEMYFRSCREKKNND